MKKKLKVLIILRKWEGGVGEATKNRKEILKKKGCSVDTLSREDDLKIFSIIKSIFPLRKKIKKLMKKEKYDIIYTCDWSIAFPLIFPFPMLKNKHFCGFGGLQSTKINFLFQKIIGLLIGKRLICYGDPVKRKFPNAHKIYNGVDFENFRPIKRIKRIKNSVGIVKRKIFVKGDPYNYKKIQKAAKKTGKKLIIAKNIPHKKMNEFYNKTETFISLPPKHTGFNLVWLEAMASGVPKIIGDNSGIGNKLPINKIENFNNLEEAIKKAKKRNYRKWLIEKKFSWEDHINKMIKVWENPDKY